MRGPVLVTGGTGVVGAPVVRSLVAEGREVRALARSDRSRQTLEALGARAVPGDILDHPSLVGALTGAATVYHLAGVNMFCPRDPAAMYTANVEGSRNVVRAAAVAGVRRMVYTSSAAALGEVTGTVGREDSPHRGSFLSHYERSKYLAEQAVFAERTPVEVVSVNPSSVQGPGRATGTGKLILDLINGKLPALIETRVSIVDIEDSARGHLLAEENGKPGERYVLNGFTLGIRDALNLLQDVTGTRIEVRFVPSWVALAGGAVAGALGRLPGQHPRLCLEMARTLVHGHAYDGSKAGRELGLEYTPPEETLRRFYEWAVGEGLVSRGG